MFRDMSTIVWKEIKEILGQRGLFKGGKAGLFILLACFGIIIPLQSGPQWVSSPLVMIYWAWVPFLLVSGIVTDSFAGERERHTLETLLASRLSDRAILAGKIGAAVLYGWGLTLGCVLIGAVAMTAVHGKGRILFYAWPVALGILVWTFLVALIASGLGVVVSLRAATVRQAAQTFSVAFLILFVPLFLLPMLPASLKAKVMGLLARADFTAAALVVTGLLLAAGVVFLLIADVRFRRNRLILD